MSQNPALIAISGQKTKVWPIPGGVHPPEHKRQSMQLPLGDVSLPSEMVFPLNQHIGAPAEPIVEPGQYVLAGEMIAKAKGMISAPVHASTSGTIIAIEERTLPHPSGMSGDCIILAPDGEDRWIDLTPCEDYTQVDRLELLQRIRDAGITGMGGAGFPTAVKLNPRPNPPITTLILNGTECEPYITADDMLMQQRADDIIKGALLIAHLLKNPARIVIGIEDNKPKAIQCMQTAAADTQIEIAVFPTKYPSGGEKQLIQILTGLEVPSGQLPASIGVVVQNVGTAVAVWEAIRFGIPLISRITTVVGEALQTQRNVQVRLGTPIQHILSEHGFDQQQAHRLIMGGPMMGYALTDLNIPVIKSSNCILAPSAKEIPDPTPAQACIRCGICAEACPAGLLPQQMYWYARAEELERLQAHNIMDCIECGACSFVCPSNIPLVQYYRASKGAIRQQAIDKEKSDLARRRFEFRQERIAKEEAEKEAKRQARKLAAEEAKKKLAANNSDADKAQVKVNTAPAPSDVVAAALASNASKALSPDEQHAKLDRLLSSARNKLERAQEKLAEAVQQVQPEESQAKLASKVKEAELRVAEAEKKLSAFSAEPSTANASTESATAADDPVAAAIARAQAKMAMPPTEKLQASLKSLQQRLEKAEVKLSEAKAEGAATVDALQAGVDKLKTKLTETQKELSELATTTPAETKAEAEEKIATPPAEMDAAQVAIERAKAKAAAQATMSPQDKLRDQLASLEKRLAKARERLIQAEASNDDNIDAFRSGVDKLEAKLAETRALLDTSN